MVVFKCLFEEPSWKVLRDGRLVCYFSDLETAKKTAAEWASNIRTRGGKASVVVAESSGTTRRQAPRRQSTVEAKSPVRKDAALQKRRVLVVEDDYHLAWKLRDAFEAAGAVVLGPYAEEETALRAIKDAIPDMAIVDLNLGEGVRFNLVDRLTRQAVPVCVVSGYGREILPAFPARLRDVTWIDKPAAIAHVVAVATTKVHGQVPNLLR